MIIETPYKINDIVSIKLNSGEEMVATIESENNDQIVVRKPLMLVAGGDGGMGLAPFMFTVDNNAKYTLKLNSIICIVKTAKDAANTYTQSTTGLTVVQ